MANSWDDFRRTVIQGQDDLWEEVQKVRDKQEGQGIDIAILKTKAGFVSAIVSAIVSIALMFLSKFLDK